MATVAQWVESGQLRSPSQLKAETGPRKKKHCSRPASTLDAAVQQSPRPTAGLKEPRAELGSQRQDQNHRLTSAPLPVLSIPSSGSSGDNRSSDSDLNPNVNSAQAAGAGQAGSDDCPSSQSGQADGSEKDDPSIQKRQIKKAKVGNSAAAVLVPQPVLSHAVTSTVSTSRTTDSSATFVSPPPSGSVYRLPAGYLPSFALIADATVVLCPPGEPSRTLAQ